ncbi:hypothetical protein MPLA_750128 [Mesorhizobium sp. ORS 3359]|nr:hypothetical protein MPLA_750128 [Mesorhizobium sp. ORS 3359]
MSKAPAALVSALFDFINAQRQLIQQSFEDELHFLLRLFSIKPGTYISSHGEQARPEIFDAGEN